MKSRKVMLIAILVVVFIAAYAVFLTQYYQRTAEQNAARDQLASLSNVAAKPVADKAPLEEELARLEAELQTNEDVFSVSLESLHITSVLVEKAGSCDVEIQQISFTPPATRKIDGIAYETLPVTIVVAGEDARILDFISRLEQEPGALKTAQISSISMGEENTSLSFYVYAIQDQSHV